MTTLDFTQVSLEKLITHHVGNKLRDERVSMSKDLTEFTDSTKDVLLKYFLLTLKTDEFYSFAHSVRLNLNEMFIIIKDLFADPKTFVTASQSIAQLLYECSLHPKIKQGELNIGHFSNVILNGETVEALGIFKSENDVAYLKMNNQHSKFKIVHDYGFEIKGVDKGCIIFNTNKNEGFRILIVDKSHQSAEAQYWKDDFLKINPLNDEYHFTDNFLKLTKQFITTALPQEHEISRTEQADLLNKSVQYFKENETFDIKEFQNAVFEDKGITKSFRVFGSKYSETYDIDIADRFEISSQAVKKQAKAFKSVLKLDKNFHIYIHGDKDLIEKGFDKQKNMSYYKVYFRNEQ